MKFYLFTRFISLFNAINGAIFIFLFRKIVKLHLMKGQEIESSLWVEERSYMLLKNTNLKLKVLSVYLDRKHYFVCGSEMGGCVRCVSECNSQIS